MAANIPRLLLFCSTLLAGCRSSDYYTIPSNSGNRYDVERGLARYIVYRDGHPVAYADLNARPTWLIRYDGANYLLEEGFRLTTLYDQWGHKLGSRPGNVFFASADTILFESTRIGQDTNGNAVVDRTIDQLGQSRKIRRLRCADLVRWGKRYLIDTRAADGRLQLYSMDLMPVDIPRSEIHSSCTAAGRSERRIPSSPLHQAS